VIKLRPNFTVDAIWRGFDSPMDVTVDRAGFVFVADARNHQIVKLTASGAVVSRWGSVGSGPRQLNWPTRVAVDHWGNVYVVDEGNHRVQTFALR
jgi:tripartite motif-containing protein 71